MVPSRSETTRLGTPALMIDCAPMMLRVRPAQFTTMVVSGDGTASCTRYASSAPGQHTPPGMLKLVNSGVGRLSRMTTSSPASSIAWSPAAETEGVPSSCSTTSPNALLGTLTPLTRV